MIHRYDEQAVLFGRTKSLVGVVARPKTDLPSYRPAVVILNTGIIHRVGHHRMYVTMARQLAAAGHVVLRFDFSGIGDSPRQKDGRSPVDACLADTQDAVDWLADSLGVSDVVLVGLCSGADIALRYGYTDPRVVGLVMLDPAIPPTTRFYVDYILQRVPRLRSWLTFAQGRGRIWRDITGRIAFAIGAGPAVENAGLVDPRSRSELEQLYRSTLERGIQLFVGTTGGDLAGRQTYREQLLDAFPNVPLKDNVHLEYFAKSDHTFTPHADRERLNAVTVDWLRTTPFRKQAAEVSSKQAPQMRVLV